MVSIWDEGECVSFFILLQKKIPKLTYLDQDWNSLSIGKIIHFFFKWSFNSLAEASTTWTTENIDVSSAERFPLEDKSSD